MHLQFRTGYVREHVSLLHLPCSCLNHVSVAHELRCFSCTARQFLLFAAGYLSYKHYKGAAGASTLKKLGQASSPQQPLSAGLPNLQQQQQHLPTDANSEQAYSGFAPQFPESANQAQPLPGQADYPSKSGTYPARSPPQGPPGSAVPSDSNPTTYQTMLDSLPPSGDASQRSAYNPVQYPNIESGGAAGQYPNSSLGVAPMSAGAHPSTGWCPFCPQFSASHTQTHTHTSSLSKEPQATCLKVACQDSASSRRCIPKPPEALLHTILGCRWGTE